MAEVGKLSNVYRPLVLAAGAGGELGAVVVASYLVAIVGREGNAVIFDELVLPFADYAGLEAEWVAGTATTVLLAAIVAAMADKTEIPYALTTEQRALLGVTVAL